MRKPIILLAMAMLMTSSFACCIFPTIPNIDLPDVNINVPTIDVGPLEEREETIPTEDVESATVDVLFGAGDLHVEAGEPGNLLQGTFSYNVEAWEPTITFEDGELTIRQGDQNQDWGIPSSSVRNTWELAFSPEVPLAINLDLGAGDGELNFTDLQITDLDLDFGAGDFDVRFDEPNPAELKRLVVDAGASQLDMDGLGNASPEEMVVTGGVGDITLDCSGDWARSATIDVSAGVGALTLRLPDRVGARVTVTDGLSSVSAPDFERSGDAYTNDAYGETDVELDIRVSAGVGQISLVESSGE